MIVPAACPIGRTSRVSGGHSRTGARCRRRAAMQVTALPALIPKLIVRLRFPSPAPTRVPSRCERSPGKHSPRSVRVMHMVRQVIVFDAADLHAESAFWAGILGGHVFEDDDWHSVIDAAGEWRIGVQLAPSHVPPDWPHGTPQQSASPPPRRRPASGTRRGNRPRRPAAPTSS
jgi:hypothetical protein